MRAAVNVFWCAALVCLRQDVIHQVNRTSEHADGSRRLFRAVIGKRAGGAVQRRFREVVRELMTDDLRDQDVGDAMLGVTSRFLTGALVELLFAWVEGKDSAQASEVERQFGQLAAPVVRAAR